MFQAPFSSSSPLQFSPITPGSFPTTSILDDFNRADTTDITGSLSWIADPFSLSGWALASNHLENGGAYIANLWNQTYTNAEVYITILTGLASTNEIAIGLRYGGTGNQSGYFLYYVHGGTPTLGIYRHDSGVATQLGGNLSFSALSNGDKLGLSMSGNTLTAWVYQSAAWSSLGTRTDGTYASGKLWLYSRYVGSTFIDLDDFGGGEGV